MGDKATPRPCARCNERPRIVLPSGVFSYCRICRIAMKREWLAKNYPYKNNPAANIRRGVRWFFTKDVASRVLQWTDKNDLEGCWPWTGSTSGPSKFAYGVISIDGRRTRVTRYLLSEKLGRPLGRFEYACHSCDNPLCVNPAHLFVGSPKDNQRDSIRKGRANRSGLKGFALTPPSERREEPGSSEKI